MDIIQTRFDFRYLACFVLVSCNCIMHKLLFLLIPQHNFMFVIFNFSNKKKLNYNQMDKIKVELDNNLTFIVPQLCLQISSTSRKHFPVLSSFMTYHWVCNQINMTGATSGAGTEILLKVALNTISQTYILNSQRQHFSYTTAITTCLYISFFI